MTDVPQGFQPPEGSPEPPYRAQVPQQPQTVPQPQIPSEPLASGQPSTLEYQPIATPEPQRQVTPEPVMAQQSPQSQQPRISADTSGVDVVGEMPHTSSYAPLPSNEVTESFMAARSGDTSTMPTAARSAIGVSQPSAGGYATQQAAAPTTASGYSRQQNAAAARLESGYASQPPTQGYTSYAQRAQAANTVAHPSTAVRQAEPKKSSGAGKSFLFGFLGALLACALAFGGMAFAGAFNASTPVVGSSTVIGTSNQSVINAAEEGQTLAEAVAAKALPSVVAIYNYQNQSSSYGYGFGYGYGAGSSDDDSLVATGMGSGVVISDDGYIITNYHVVENASKLTVSVNGVERDATYVGGDSSSDIAVVKVDDTEGLVSADIGDSDSLRIGEWVMTVGAPLGLESSVATGVVSATNRSTIMDSSSNANDLYSYFYGNQAPEYTYYPNMIQTDAVINPGNSGGALVDADGKLIGINAMISSYSGDYAGVGFAIPINYAISLAKDIIDGKQPTHAMMGVSLSQVNSAVAQQYNLSAESGAYVSAITEGTGAADSDLQIGDIITKIDGKAVTSPTDVTLKIRAHKPGDTVAVTVNRNGEVMDIDVILGSDENMSAASSQESEQEQGQRDGEELNQGPWGNGRGDDGGYTREQLEELLRMLGY